MTARTRRLGWRGWAGATSAGLKEKRSLAAPSGLGSFDACIFDLADDDVSVAGAPAAAAPVTMMLQGKGDYLSTPCKPLPSGPEWD